MSDEYQIREINLDKLADFVRAEGELGETPALHLLDTIRVMREQNLALAVKLAHATNDADRLQKESVYYKNAVRQRGPLPAIPPFVPSRVRVNCTVCGDTPFNSTYVEPGEYDCLSNRRGAVSVISANGKALGLRLEEFDVLLWRENEEAKAVRP